jgi:hypothetical protein
MGETLPRVGYSRQVLKRDFELPVTDGADSNHRRCAKPFYDSQIALRHSDQFLTLSEMEMRTNTKRSRQMASSTVAQSLDVRPQLTFLAEAIR